MRIQKLSFLQYQALSSLIMLGIWQCGKIMQPQQHDPHTLCPKCQNFIRTANFLIHQSRCRGQSSVHRPMSRSNSSRIFSSRFSNPPSLINQPEEEKIPCHFCGYAQTLAELDTHPAQCAHRQTSCQGCGGSFPLSLMQQHLFVCPAMLRQQEQQEEQEVPRMRHEQRLNPMQHIISDFLTMGMRLDHPPGRMRGPPLQQRNSPRRSRRRQPRGQGDLLSFLVQIMAGNQSEGSRGLNEQQIKKFKVKKFDENTMNKKNEQPEKCVVCYCDFENGDDCTQLHCKHIFHPECINKWLQKNPLCPVCKQDSLGRKKQDVEREEPGDRHPQRILFRFNHF